MQGALPAGTADGANWPWRGGMKFQGSLGTALGGQTPRSPGGRESRKVDLEGPGMSPEYAGL